jgi:uncharacterized protein involved in tolerance to divalent cations
MFEVDGYKFVDKAEVAKLHSYDIFVLKQIPITNLSHKAGKWLEQETQSKTDKI